MEKNQGLMGNLNSVPTRVEIDLGDGRVTTSDERWQGNQRSTDAMSPTRAEIDLGNGHVATSDPQEDRDLG